MTHCAKCGAELIGSRKFCAACGTPAGDPRSPAASTGQAPVMSNRGLGVPSGPGAPHAPGSAPGSNPANAGSAPSIQYAPPPASQVNPFAQTANPITHRQQRAPDYGPPPSIPAELGNTTKGVGEPGPPAAPGSAPAAAHSPPAHQVSPLAISNVSSQRGAFENAVTSGPASMAAVAAGLVGVITHPDNEPSQGGSKRSPVAGTQMMPSSANPGAALSVGAPSAAGAGAVSKRQDRTQLLAAFPPGTVPRPGAPAPAPGSAPSGAGAPGGAAGSAPPGAQSAGSMQAADPQRVSSVPNLAAAYAPPPPMQQPPQQTAPVQPVIHPPHPQHPPVPPPQAPAQMQPPGAWSPAAVSFPVGQPSPALPYGGAPPPFAQPPPPQPMAPAPPPAPYGYGFAYVPGSRVTVTWSNGGRYPGTVQQVSGTQCLVAFPDGQQHWVEMQYVAPA